MKKNLNDDQSLSQIKENEPTNLKDLLSKYLSHWKMFILTLIITNSFALIYLRYGTKLYDAQAVILIKSGEKGGGIPSELSVFKDFGLAGTSSSIDNEIQILKSRNLISKTVKELKLNVSYFNNEALINKKELWLKNPFTITFLKGDSSIYDKKANFEIELVQNSKFKVVDKNFNIQQIYTFGETVYHPILGKFILTPSSIIKGNPSKAKKVRKFIIQITPLDLVIEKYQLAIKTESVSKESNAISLKLVDLNPDKAVDILNNLIEQHRKDAVADKNTVAKNTSIFINERISFITDELLGVEKGAESYKKINELIDVTSEATLFIENSSENDKSIIKNETQIRLSEFVINYLQNNNSTSDLIPSNLGLSNPAIEKTIDLYNELVLERNRLLKNSTTRNPIIQNLEGQILGMQQGIKVSLNNMRESLKIENRALEKQESILKKKINQVPQYEREYREIQRQQQIKESLYLYLLQKREETELSLAVTESNSKIIDSAYSTKKVISPKKQITYLLAIFLGLIVPIGIIYLRNILDTKLHSGNEIQALGLPYIGDIPTSNARDKIVVGHGKNDSVSEAFRILRTNVDYILQSEDNVSKSKVIFVTSTIAREGKSFVSINLASIIALAGKKVLLVGLDLRAPKILEYTGVERKKGVTNFISDVNLSLSDIIIEKPHDINFDLILSGDIPPNPSELLINPRLLSLFLEVREMYDYVIVDTAPLAPVTDTLLISKIANMTVYVARANYLDRRLLTIPKNLYEDKKLQNMAVLINDSNNKRGYGYGYGYGVEKPKKPWFKKIFGK